jgi:hypothetical protein
MHGGKVKLYDLCISLPEVAETVEEREFVVQKYGAVVSFRYFNRWPGTHITESLIRHVKSVV